MTHPAIQRATTYLRSAEVLFEEEDFESLVSRTYYAMFYMARALLQQKGIETKTHSGLRQQFGLHFVKDGPMSTRFARMLDETEDLRALAEYAESAGVISAEDARASIDAARSFLERVRRELEA